MQATYVPELLFGNVISHSPWWHHSKKEQVLQAGGDKA